MQRRKLSKWKWERREIKLTQYKARWCCGKHAWRNQQYRMRPFECAIHKTADTHCKHSHNKRCNNRLHLHQCNVTHNHVDDITSACHATQIGLGRQTRCKTHIQVSLQTQQCRHQNEQLRNMCKHLPSLHSRRKGRRSWKLMEILLHTNFEEGVSTFNIIKWGNRFLITPICYIC